MPEQQIIVTGGSRGIGAAIVTELDRRGYGVTALSRSGNAPAGRGVACDVSDARSVTRAIEDAAQKGPLVGIVNNAGLHTSATSATLAAAEFEATIRMNATSVLTACQAAYPFLAAAESSLIVNIGSFFDKLGVARNLAYCASKAAVGAITRCLAVEWASDGIRVLNIAPGYIQTDLNAEFFASEKARAWIARRAPVGRPGHVEEVARLVASAFVENIGFLTGETIYIDGGQGTNH